MTREGILQSRTQSEELNIVVLEDYVWQERESPGPQERCRRKVEDRKTCHFFAAPVPVQQIDLSKVVPKHTPVLNLSVPP